MIPRIIGVGLVLGALVFAFVSAWDGAGSAKPTNEARTTPPERTTESQAPAAPENDAPTPRSM